jgi:hypothetical protein
MCTFFNLPDSGHILVFPLASEFYSNSTGQIVADLRAAWAGFSGQTYGGPPGDLLQRIVTILVSQIESSSACLNRRRFHVMTDHELYIY